MKTNIILKNISHVFYITIFVIIFSCFLLEILSRIFVQDPDPDLAPCTSQNQDPYDSKNQCYTSQEDLAKMEYNTFIGYIPTANTAGVGWYTNNAHFRYNDALYEEKPKDEIRIFITGGSAAWGAGVRQDQTFAHILEERLKKLLSSK